MLVSSLSIYIEELHKKFFGSSLYHSKEVYGGDATQQLSPVTSVHKGRSTHIMMKMMAVVMAVMMMMMMIVRYSQSFFPALQRPIQKPIRGAASQMLTDDNVNEMCMLREGDRHCQTNRSPAVLLIT